MVEVTITCPLSIDGTNVNILDVRVDSTDPSNAFVDCAFNKVGYNCTIQYGTDPSYTNLTDEDTSSTVSQNATITLTQQLESNTNYYYIVSAENSSQCVKVRGRFRTGEYVTFDVNICCNFCVFLPSSKICENLVHKNFAYIKLAPHVVLQHVSAAVFLKLSHEDSYQLWKVLAAGHAASKCAQTAHTLLHNLSAW